MLILAIDTTSEVGGVGVFRDSECLTVIRNQGQENHYSVTLFEMVEQSLAQVRRQLSEVDLYAVANGPGSFTGIRVGLAAARAWGKAFERPVRGVSVLDAIANAARPTSDWVFPIIDARRGEFFVGCFRQCKAQTAVATPAGTDSVTKPPSLKAGVTPEAAFAVGLDYEPVDDGLILKPDSLYAFVQDHTGDGATATCVVRAHDRAAADLRAGAPVSMAWQQVEGVLLRSIAEIARNEEIRGLPCPAAKLDAYYLRRPDAEIKLGTG